MNCGRSSSATRARAIAATNVSAGEEAPLRSMNLPCGVCRSLSSMPTPAASVTASSPRMSLTAAAKASVIRAQQFTSGARRNAVAGGCFYSRVVRPSHRTHLSRAHHPVTSTNALFTARAPSLLLSATLNRRVPRTHTQKTPIPRTLTQPARSRHHPVSTLNPSSPFSVECAKHPHCPPHPNLSSSNQTTLPYLRGFSLHDAAIRSPPAMHSTSSYTLSRLFIVSLFALACCLRGVLLDERLARRRALRDIRRRGEALLHALVRIRPLNGGGERGHLIGAPHDHTIDPLQRRLRG